MKSGSFLPNSNCHLDCHEVHFFEMMSLKNVELKNYSLQGNYNPSYNVTYNVSIMLAYSLYLCLPNFPIDQANI